MSSSKPSALGLKLASVDLEKVPDGIINFMGVEVATGNVGEEKFEISAAMNGIFVTGKHVRYGIRYKAIMEGVARAMEAELQGLTP